MPRLLEAGYQVRCLIRDPSRTQGRAWVKRVQLLQGDMLDPQSLAVVMRDVDTVYYLIHSLGSGSDSRSGIRRRHEIALPRPDMQG